MATIGDFDLLRHARQDIRDQPWAQGPTREAIKIHLNLQRAEEERTRLNIEINRLLTALFDAHVDLSVAAAKCEDPTLAAELRKCLDYHNLVGERIVSSLVSASNLPEFTGSLSIGRQIGRSPAPHIPPPPWIHIISSTPSTTKDVDFDTMEAVDSLVDFFDAIEL